MAHQAARASGSRAVMAAVGATVAAVGVGTIYLPFIADRDKMRGLHEEETPPMSAMLAKEVEKLQKEGLLKRDDDDDDQRQSSTPPMKGRSAGSMWKNMK